MGSALLNADTETKKVADFPSGRRSLIVVYLSSKVLNLA